MAVDSPSRICAPASTRKSGGPHVALRLCCRLPRYMTGSIPSIPAFSAARSDGYYINNDPAAEAARNLSLRMLSSLGRREQRIFFHHHRMSSQGLSPPQEASRPWPSSIGQLLLPTDRTPLAPSTPSLPRRHGTVAESREPIKLLFLTLNSKRESRPP